MQLSILEVVSATADALEFKLAKVLTNQSDAAACCRKLRQLEWFDFGACG
jgi:hypothetical protein